MERGQRKLLPLRRVTTPSEHGPRVLLSSIAWAVAFAGLAALYSFWLFRYQVQWEHHLRLQVWFQPGDFWMMVDGGRFVWHGALGYVYRGSGQSYALPLSYILAAPLAAVVDHFRLAEPILPIKEASAWPVGAAFLLTFNVFVLDGVRRLAWDLGARRKLWLVQAATVVIVCVPAFEYGHFEDVLALTFVLHAVRYLFAGRMLECCLMISLAISFKQWALLAVPLAIALSPKGRRLIGLAVSAALPLLLAAIVLATDPRHAATALFLPANPKRTDPGHLSFLFTAFGDRTSRIMRSVAVLATIPLAYLGRRVRRTEGVFALLSVLLVLRPLFEPMNYAYYWMPALTIAGLVGVASTATFRIRDWAWQIAATIWALPHGNPSSITLWWVVEGALLSLTWLQMAINCGLVRTPARRRTPRVADQELVAG